MRIGYAAARAGVTADAIRYYERIGLLATPPRTASGYRQYSEAAVQRIILVRAALAFGFSTKQVAGFLRARDAGRPPCREVRAAGGRMLSAVEKRIQELVAARDELRVILQLWDERLASADRSAPAHLLESLRRRPRRSLRLDPGVGSKV